jgi:hypothetical protein
MTGPFYVTYPVGDTLLYTSEAGEKARYDTAEEAATVADNVLKLGLADYARVHRWEAPVEAEPVSRHYRPFRPKVVTPPDCYIPRRHH